MPSKIGEKSEQVSDVIIGTDQRLGDLRMKSVHATRAVSLVDCQSQLEVG
jgi:hypothetical protein